jgi:hypothetical protein
MMQVCFVLGRAPEAEQWMANAYLNAANVYSQTQRFNKAIPFAQKSIAKYDSLGETEKSIKSFNYFG